MKLLKNKQIIKSLSVMLTILTVLSVITPVLLLNGGLSIKTAAESVAQNPGYQNPYKNHTPEAALSDRISYAENTTAITGNSFQIASVDDLLTLAEFSQHNNCESLTVGITMSGILDISGNTDFHGIGNESYPFAGTVNGIWQDDEQTEIITGAYSFFNCISNKASLTKLKFTSSSSSSGLADRLVADHSVSGTYTSVSVNGSVANSFNGGNAAMLFGNVSKSGAISSATLDLSQFDVLSSGITANDGSAALLIGKMDSGITLNLTLGAAGISVSNSSHIIANGGDAGLLVGNMGSGSALNIAGNVTLTGNSTDENITSYRKYSSASGSATDRGGNAGSFAGCLESGAYISVTGSLSVSGAVIAGGNAVGGLAGRINDGYVSASLGADVSSVIRGGVYCGGVAGYLGFAAADSHTSAVFAPTALDSFSNTIIPTDDLTFGKAGAGGLYGKLNISGTSAMPFGFTVDFTNGAAINTVFKNVPGEGTDVDAAAGKDNICLGGLIGINSSDNIKNGLTVDAGSSIKTVSTSTYDTTSGVYCYGGIIGISFEGSYCNLKNTGLSVKGSGNTGSDDVYTLNMGGVCAVLSNNAVLDINGITVDGRFCAKYNEACAGGIAAYTGEGAVLRLNGDMNYGDNTYGITSEGEGSSNVSNPNYADYSGQIVGRQESSLIFGESDWKFSRCHGSENIGYFMDDIGNYGEVFRNTALDSSITFDTSAHTVSISPVTGSSASAVTLLTAGDCVKLAVTLGSHGHFSGIRGVTDANYTDLLDAAITVGNDIDLSGRGIVCFTRNDTAEAFTGTVTGGNNTITLGIGVPYYETAGTHGNGEIYGQPYLGLFAALGNTAQISNLTVDGYITCGQATSGFTLKNDCLMYAGGLAGYATGTVDITGVTTALNISEKNSRQYSSNNNNEGYYGGILGFYSGNSLTVTDCTGDADITVNSSYSLNSAVTGGLVGAISSNNDGNKFENSVLTGSLTAAGAIKDMTAGGLVGKVTSTAANPDKKLTIDCVSIPETGGQTISAPLATVSSGSLIIHTAKNITVLLTNTSEVSGVRQKNTLYGSISSGLSVETNTPAANFGGLFFEITGKLALDYTEIYGSFSGNHSISGTDFSDGVVVCRGYGLYMTVDASTVTVEPTVTEGRGIRCDDLVGNNKSSAAGHNGAIVTIQTKTGGTADSIGSTAHPWTYSHADRKNNPNTRYYYNVEGLDIDHGSAYRTNVITNNQFTCKEDLLLWHILNYTSFTLQKKIQTSDTTNSSFPGSTCSYFFTHTLSSFEKNKSYTSTTAADFDMTGGFCLYPTTVTGGTYDFNTKTIKFDNTAVNNAINDASANTTATLCQHYMMQTGLFYNVTSNMTVKDVTVSGNVGMWSGGSGAIICGTVDGVKSGSVYSSSNLSLQKISINDLFINGSNNSNNYAPLILNKINTYVTAGFSEFTESYTNSAAKAASSLIGSVGYINKNTQGAITSAASHLNISFSKMVVRSSNSASPFYRSSFIDSFYYNTDGSSSGIYNYTFNEDWGTPQHQVTYGYELEDDNTKYLDKQTVFVDPGNNNHTASPAYDFNGNYLPYVYRYVTPETNKTSNKLSVNIAGNLDEGCGTYEDPYIIRTTQQLMQLKQCINSGIPGSWQVCYPNDSLCDGTDHTLWTYDSTAKTFKNGSNTKSIPVSWFSHAYYRLGHDIVISASDNFYGLGTSGNEHLFSGMFSGLKEDGSGSHSVTVPRPADAQDNTVLAQMGFINSSAGCVLKDIDIIYSDDMTLKLSTDAAADSYFGGAIGCVWGGDNIIDNVDVTIADVSLKSRKIYAGGYVGLVMAGGVIFRNMSGHSGVSFSDTDSAVITGGDTDWFYANPYIGRVLDAYAIYESIAGSVDNTDKNYKIQTLDPNVSSSVVQINHIGTPSGIKNSRQYNQVTVTNNIGLFVFASSLNCGAQSTGNVYAYAKSARARNAHYSDIGCKDTASNDRTEALKENPRDTEDSSSRVYTSYLCKTYMTSTSTSDYRGLVTSSGQRTVLYLAGGGNFDLSSFGNGFRGVGSRYTGKNNMLWSNKTTSNATSYDRTTFISEDALNLVSFDGGNNTLSYKMNVRQYTSDPYLQRWATYGLFNNTNNSGEQTNKSATYRNVTLGNAEGSRSCLEVHEYILSGTSPETASESTDTNQAYKDDGTSGKLPLSTGALIGAMRVGATGAASCVMNITNVTLTNFDIASCSDTGGIIGNITSRGGLVSTGCVLNNIKVTGRQNVGGFVGNDNVLTDITFSAEQNNITVVNNAVNSSNTGGIGGIIGLFSNSTASTAAAPVEQNCKITGADLNNITLISADISDWSTITNSDAKIAINASENMKCNSGGIVGYVTNTPESIKIINTSVDNLLSITKNNAGALVGQINSGNITVSSANVGTQSPIRIISGSNSSGIIGYSLANSTIESVAVGNSSSSGSLISLNRGAGIIGRLYSDNSISSTITDSSVQNMLIYGTEISGGIIGYTAEELAVNSVSVKNCVILADSGNLSSGTESKSSAGIIANSGGTVYLSNVTSSGNKIATFGGTNYAGGIIRNVVANVYGSNILSLNERLGIVNSSTKTAVTNGTAPTVTSNSGCAIWIQNIGTGIKVSLSAISRQGMDIRYKECGGSGSTTAALVYADYDGTGPDGDGTAALGSDVPVNPVRTLGTDTYYSDGIADGKPIKIYNEAVAGTVLGRYKYAASDLPNISSARDTYLTTVGSYFAGAASAAANLPLLYVKGDSNALITEYANLLTNGGFSAFRSNNAAGTSLSVTTAQYSVTAAATEKLSGEGSVEYSSDRFSARQNYDSLTKEGSNVTAMTFTVITVTFSNPAGGTQADYDMSFAVYYPQVLTIDRNVQLINHEEYDINKIVQKTKTEQLPGNSEEDVNIAVGGVFTAYFEYVYNDLREYDNWNYRKYIRINEGLPTGTKITLIDLNTADAEGIADSNGYRAYFLTVGGGNIHTGHELIDGTQQNYYYINLDSFTSQRRDETAVPFAEKQLMQLPKYDSSNTISHYDYSDADTSKYGSERYLMVVRLPNLTGTDNKQYRYNFFAGLDPTAGDTRNVERTEINDHKRIITAWPNPDIAININGNTSQKIAVSETIDADYDYSVEFPEYYTKTFMETPGKTESSEKYGVIKYAITDGTNEITLPAGTLITVGNTRITADGSSSYYQSVIKGADGNNLKILQYLYGENKDTFDYSQHISLDFSNVEPSQLRAAFPTSNGVTSIAYELRADFFLTTDPNSPAIGQSGINNDLKLNSETSNTAILKVNVDSQSLLHLGVNSLDPDDDTNNGVIHYTVVLDISGCENIDNIIASGVTLNSQLQKKNETDSYTDVTGNYIESSDFGTPSYDVAAKQYKWNCTLTLNPPDSGDDFANYRFTVTAGGFPLNSSVYPSDYFVYTVANILPEFVD